MKLDVDFCGFQLKNPIVAASGTFGFGREYDAYYDISGLGGICVKGLTCEARQGNPPPRIVETSSGMLNSVGLQNPGVDSFIEKELPWLLSKNTIVIANIAGNTMEDYALMAQKLSKTDVHMLELNISCPNVKHGGAAFGAHPDMVFEITRLVRAEAKKPMIVKLSPNTADIRETAKAAEEAGADALSLINTITGMAIDVYAKKPILANIIGGLSGPAIMPVALRMVWQAASIVNIPIMGMGGIMTGEDVAAFLLAGASAVQVGTANIVDPLACMRILDEFKQYLQITQTLQTSDLIGRLKI